MKDPTADEMRAFLIDQFPPDGEDPIFDLESAIYWFACDYHGGQTSNLYSALSTSDYRPGPLENGVEPDSLASLMLDALISEYA